MSDPAKKIYAQASKDERGGRDTFGCWGTELPYRDHHDTIMYHEPEEYVRLSDVLVALAGLKVDPSWNSAAPEYDRGWDAAIDAAGLALLEVAK